MNLDTFRGDIVRRARGLRLRHRGRDLAIGSLDVGRPRRVVHRDACNLDLTQHVDRLVPRHLELRERLAEHLPSLRVVERESAGGLAHADQLRREQYGRIVGDPAPEVRVIAGRADEERARLVEFETGELARDIEGCGELRVPAGILDEERLQSVAGACRHQYPVGGTTVHDEGLDPVELVTRPPARRADPDAFDRIAVTGFVERDRAAPRSRAQFHEPVVETECARGERRDDRRG